MAAAVALFEASSDEAPLAAAAALLFQLLQASEAPLAAAVALFQLLQASEAPLAAASALFDDDEAMVIREASMAADDLVKDVIVRGAQHLMRNCYCEMILSFVSLIYYYRGNKHE